MKKPTSFGKYLLLERINIGGMAEVFTAKAFGVEGFERILAIKKILPTMAEDQEFITMFIDEARISVQLNHANIVHIHELGKHEDTYFIAMEYVAGRDLRTLLERYRRRKEIMPTAQSVFIASKMCEGLDYAHRKKDPRGQDLGIIHRDVSPQNILISYEGEVKIIDFGIAKAANRSQKTQAGILKGKFGYMSPEQVRGMPIDRRSDIFAVGVILYEMLTGERLFVGESDFSTLEKVRNADVPSPRDYNQNIPAGLERVLLKALAREPEERYQWASDMQEDLMRFLLAGDAIYSSKHLSAFMKEVFAEDIIREAEKMERYSSIERPEPPQASNAGALARPPRRVPTAPVAGRAPTMPSQPAVNDFLPPLSDEELAEMDGAGDKTQIVDSVRALQPPPSRPSSSSSVLVDDSLTGERDNPLSENASRPQPRRNFASEAVAGEEEEEGGATMVGISPFALAEDGERDANATRIGEIDPEEDNATVLNLQGLQSLQGESGATMVSPMPTGERPRLRPEELERPRPARRPPETEPEEDEVSDSSEPQAYDSEEESTGRMPVPVETPKPVSGRKRVAASKEASREPGKKGSPKILLGAVAAGALVVLGVVGFLLFSGPGTGSLMVSVQPSMGAEVRIDGQVQAQNQVIQLPEGPHTVTATAPGHRPAEKQVSITRQSPAVVSLVLTPSSQAEQVEEGGAVGTGASAGTGTAMAEAASDVPSEPTQADEPVEEEPPTFEAVFEGTSGAEIEVEGKSVGKMPGVKLAGLTLGQRYGFTAKREGYKTYTGNFSSDDGDTELVVRFAMEKEVPPPPVESRPTVRQSSSSKSPRPSRTVKGKLACSSRPPGAQIWVDGRYSGRETPVALGNPLVLPVGTHTIIFKLDGKQSKPKKVTITAGEVAKLINVPLE